MPENTWGKPRTGRETEEQKRLSKNWEEPYSAWEKWGPYVSERAWGTVREDYSPDGNAWTYFPFDLAQTKTYRWGEDAIAGWCDRYQVLVLAPVFWNTKDPILKERLFGLGSTEGNHGEDVKEYYYHLDATPSHSYLKYLYKYPQKLFPYEHLARRKLEKDGPEIQNLKSIDTGVFDENRYFDIFIEYAKAIRRRYLHSDRAIESAQIRRPCIFFPIFGFAINGAGAMRSSLNRRFKNSLKMFSVLWPMIQRCVLLALLLSITI